MTPPPAPTVPAPRPRSPRTTSLPPSRRRPGTRAGACSTDSRRRRFERRLPTWMAPGRSCDGSSLEQPAGARIPRRAPLRQRRDRRAAKSRPGAQEAPRVDGHAVDPGLVMEMSAGRAAGRADAADERAGRNLLAGHDPDRGEVGVAGREAVAVVDLDHAAVAAGIFGRRDRAG